MNGLALLLQEPFLKQSFGDADYHGKRGDAYYVTRTRTVTIDGKSKEETYQERKIRWTSVSGHVRHAFDDVLVQASDTMGKQGKTAVGRSVPSLSTP